MIAIHLTPWIAVGILAACAIAFAVALAFAVYCGEFDGDEHYPWDEER